MLVFTHALAVYPPMYGQSAALSYSQPEVFEKMQKYSKKMLIASCLLSLTTVNAFADADECPDATKTAIDAKYGAALDGTPASALTSCLKRRENVKAVVSVNSADWNGKARKPRQVGNIFNLVNNYTEMYGMQANQDFEVVAIGYAAGARWWLTDEAFDRIHGTKPDVFEPNPAKASVLAMLAAGVKVLMCQNTMKANNYLTADVIPGVTLIPSGVSGIIDYQFQGFKYLNP